MRVVGERDEKRRMNSPKQSCRCSTETGEEREKESCGEGGELFFSQGVLWKPKKHLFTESSGNGFCAGWKIGYDLPKLGGSVL